MEQIKLIHFNKMIEQNCESSQDYFFTYEYDKMYLGKKIMYVHLLNGKKLIGYIEKNTHILREFLVRFK